MAEENNQPPRWFPLGKNVAFCFQFLVFLICILSKESNPEVMTTYISNLGVDTSEYRVCDVLALEEWALDMVPQPVLGFF